MKLNSAILISGLLFFASCSGGGEKTEGEAKKEEQKTISEDAMSKNGITVYEADILEKFDGATLKLVSPQEDKANVGSNKFKFEVTNYELGAQTDDAKKASCANSDQGQHIHFIVNNEPYLAKYTPEFEAELGTENNIILAFLSRSYHESIKNDAASVLFSRSTSVDTVTTNNETLVTRTTIDSLVDLTDPMLFYSRPKGSYSGDDAKKLLLDFYLKNVELAEDGYKVKAIINGNEFILEKWVPYFVEGLPMGDNTFQLQLLDEDNNVVIQEGTEGPGIFSDSGERIVKLAEG